MELKHNFHIIENKKSLKAFNRTNMELKRGYEI